MAVSFLRSFYGLFTVFTFIYVFTFLPFRHMFLAAQMKFGNVQISRDSSLLEAISAIRTRIFGLLEASAPQIPILAFGRPLPASAGPSRPCLALPGFTELHMYLVL